MKIFLSYAVSDEGLARDLRKLLVARGFEVWDPSIEIFPGDNWALKTGQALEESDAMVALMTDAYTNSRWGTQELSYALGNERYRRRLIPIVIRGQRVAPNKDYLQPVVMDPAMPGEAVAQIENALKTAV